MNYDIGLRIGITSCGWAIINKDLKRIEDLGVRVFEKAENPDGTASAAPRREARKSRRKNRRKKHRIERIKRLIVQHDLLSKKEMDTLYLTPFDIEVWNLRVEALERKLDNREFARVLIHLVQRRGFQTNRKSVETQEEGKLLENISENDRIMKENGYKTVGEMFINHEKFKHNKRNKDGNYSNVVARSLLLTEIKAIFDAQRRLGNLFANPKFELDYLYIWGSQRPTLTYEQLMSMVGNCIFEKKEKRAPKASWAFQYFLLLQKVNKLKVLDDNTLRNLSKEERDIVIKLAFKKKKVSFMDIRKALNLNENTRFNHLTYSQVVETKKVEKATFIELKGYHLIRKHLKYIDDDLHQELETQDYDAIAAASTFFKNDTDIRDYLRNQYVDSKGIRKSNVANKMFEDNVIAAVSELNFSKVCHLSFKALYKLIPHLEKGLNYEEAILSAGYNLHDQNKRNKKLFLPVMKQETNPIVHRALTQARKVINAIIREYGSPNTIRFVVANNLTKTYKERKEIESILKKNRADNEKIKTKLLNMGIINPTGMDIVMYKLWYEQSGYCLYTGRQMELSRIFKPGYSIVNHIIPYNRSFDDTYHNRVLTLTETKYEKGNKIPFEYFGTEETWWNEYEERVNAIKKIHDKKRENLLIRNFYVEYENEMISNNIFTNHYIGSCFEKYIDEHLQFKKSSMKQKVFSIQEKMVAHLHSRWGFNKSNREIYLNHAVDAAIVAVITDQLIYSVAEYYRRDNNREQKGDYMFPEPWKSFSRELEARISPEVRDLISKLNLDSYLDKDFSHIKPVFISKKPRRKVIGEAHKSTIRSPIGINEKGKMITSIKTKLEDIPFDENGNFPMYGKETDKYTYTAIKERYLEFNKDKEKAFSKPLYKLKKNGEPGNQIKSVKIIDTRNIVNQVNQGKGIAYNSNITRVDVFTKDQKYYVVPIYLSNFIKRSLPNKIITAAKGFMQWPEVDNSYTFLFSIFPNDLIKVVPKEGKFIKAKNENKENINLTEILGYFKGLDSSTGAFTLESHDGSLLARGIGTKNLLLIEKYQVDVLGRYNKVGNEERQDIKIQQN
ncbi:TPA: type II CRISPR RNA-guided endonuclease Cas9 [Bacillus cereus]|nr:type II CRISPR RNA-guided endonuclease Cas9 [Bacillus cereus]HDR8508731.1 type II CRISPR RNA-guided endonuclease Cas9 [Bacillus cereus]HDR8533596.1 type II CRISPR RNA-guided endonuclease Cas9 [Bacillus cereus]HDX9676778.1 type II CRISPR RNA-guided endonuclease Cas9 [Bacillus cereus]